MTKRTRCLNCIGCNNKETPCGACRYCLDMKKFGGSGRLKQACILTKCRDLKLNMKASREEKDNCRDITSFGRRRKRRQIGLVVCSKIEKIKHQKKILVKDNTEKMIENNNVKSDNIRRPKRKCKLPEKYEDFLVAHTTWWLTNHGISRDPDSCGPLRNESQTNLGRSTDNEVDSTPSMLENNAVAVENSAATESNCKPTRDMTDISRSGTSLVSKNFENNDTDSNGKMMKNNNVNIDSISFSPVGVQSNYCLKCKQEVSNYYCADELTPEAFEYFQNDNGKNEATGDLDLMMVSNQYGEYFEKLEPKEEI